MGLKIHECRRCGSKWASKREDVQVAPDGTMGPKRCGVCKKENWWRAPKRSVPARKKK